MKNVVCALGLVPFLSGCFDAAPQGPYDAAECQRMIEEFRDSNIDAGLADRSDSLAQAIGKTGQAVARIHAMESKLRAHGCPMGFSDNPEPMRPKMTMDGMATDDREQRARDAEAAEPERPRPPQLGQDPEPTTRLDGY